LPPSTKPATESLASLDFVLAFPDKSSTLTPFKFKASTPDHILAGVRKPAIMTTDRKHTGIELDQLIKLRLTVARFGEMDGAAWWNTQGVLGKAGRSVLARGFPATHWFAQARIVCAVASARCTAVFSPPECFTLWNLPAEIEDAVSRHWSAACRNPKHWVSFFEGLVPRNSGDLLHHLQEQNLIGDTTVHATTPLRRSAEGKAVALPGTGHATRDTVMLLAAAFSKGEKQNLAVPYIRSDS
jgi:hypothetical protein